MFDLKFVARQDTFSSSCGSCWMFSHMSGCFVVSSSEISIMLTLRTVSSSGIPGVFRFTWLVFVFYFLSFRLLFFLVHPPCQSTIMLFASSRSTAVFHLHLILLAFCLLLLLAQTHRLLDDRFCRFYNFTDVK